MIRYNSVRNKKGGNTMPVRFKIAGNDLVFSIQEEITINNANELRDEIISQFQANSDKRIVLDLKETWFVDSAGMGILYNLRKKIVDQKGKICLKSINPEVRKILELTKLIDFFEIIS